MNVDVLQATDNADRLVCACARGDYMEDSLYDVDLHVADSYNEIIEGATHGEEDDYEYAEQRWEEKYGKQFLEGEGEYLHDTFVENVAKTRGLIRNLIRKGHYGPFEHPRITFAIEGISRSCMAQMTRHRHASFDVQSMRYCSFEEAEPIVPESMEDVGGAYPQPHNDVTRPQNVAESYLSWYEWCVNVYQQMVENGVPKEDARMVLPIGTKINLTASFNLRSLMHVVDMRLAGDAQHEARDLAEEMFNLAKDVAPITFKMYEEWGRGDSKKAP